MANPRPDRSCVRYAGTIALAGLAAAMVVNACRAEGAGDSPHGPGARAIGFDWTSDSFYGVGSSTQTMGFTFKRHASETTAYRVGVGADFQESEQKGLDHQVDSYYATTVDLDVDNHSESHGYSVYLQWMKWRPVRDHVSFFVALGPSFGFGSSRSSYSGASSTRLHESIYGSTRRSVALLGHVGFEWLFVKRVSLSGQVASIGAYEWGNGDTTYHDANLSSPYFDYVSHERTNSKGVRFRTGRAAFMISAYL
jgi:hypothetical protein